MKEKIINFIKDELNPDAVGLELSSDEDLLSTGLIESLGMMQLFQFLETEFSIKVEPIDMSIENFISVDAMTVFIKQAQ